MERLQVLNRARAAEVEDVLADADVARIVPLALRDVGELVFDRRTRSQRCASSGGADLFAEPLLERFILSDGDGAPVAELGSGALRAQWTSIAHVGIELDHGAIVRSRMLSVKADLGNRLPLRDFHGLTFTTGCYVEPRPMNWGHNLTLVGAVRRTGWVGLTRGDIVVLDNLKAHHAPAVRALIEARGAQVLCLPPYSYDFNPIEPVWALVKKHIRSFASRTAVALRRVARAARDAVTPDHCHRCFAHAGYVNSTAVRS